MYSNRNHTVQTELRGRTNECSNIKRWCCFNTFADVSQQFLHMLLRMLCNLDAFVLLYCNLFSSTISWEGSLSENKPLSLKQDPKFNFCVFCLFYFFYFILLSSCFHISLLSPYFAFSLVYFFFLVSLLFPSCDLLKSHNQGQSFLLQQQLSDKAVHCEG